MAGGAGRDQTDAVVPVTVGTVAWGVALVVTSLLRSRLAEHDAQWWVGHSTLDER